MWLPYRSLLVYLIGGAVMMGLFLFFAYGIGWPKDVDSCVKDVVHNKCYCEHFNLADITSGKKGVRQPANTWFNLYAFGTAGVVMAFMWYDRAKQPNHTVPIRSKSWIADLYVFAVLFLGLGSMWFHASLAKDVSWMDGLSMYVFTGYLASYTVDRYLRKKQVSEKTRLIAFWSSYLGATALCTVLGVIGVPSPILIGALVAAYATFEFFFAGFITKFWAVVYWLIGLFAMENAIVFWIMSQTNATMCDTDEKMKSLFQPHGLLWHPLAGVMAVMMYFYWRCEGATPVATAAAEPASRWT